MSASARTVTAVAALTLVTGAMLPGGSGAAAETGSAATMSAPQPMPSDAMTDVGSPAISSSGRYIAHIAVRRDQASQRRSVRRTDLTTGGFELLNPSVDGGGAAPGNYSMPPVMSSDGARVAFTSNGARLVAGDTNGRFDAFVRDATTDTTLLSSAASDGGISNGASGMTSLSKDGRFAVFTSTATDVVPGSTTTNSDVYRRDLSSHTTVQVTLRPNGAPSRGPGSTSADVSADGNLVAFNSYDSDLVAGDGDGESDLFVRTMTTGQTRSLSAGLPAGANPSGVVISPDGQWVSSRWDDGSLHLTKVGTAATTSVAAEGYALLGAFSSQPGRFVFVSGGRPWLRDLATGVDTAISTPAGSGVVSTVTISANGRFVAYDWAPAGGGASRIYRVTLA